VVLMPHRRDEPGYFVVVDETGKEIAGSKRIVASGFDRARDELIVRELQRAMGEGCEVVFKPEPDALR
jgi:hypothetical protein